MTADFTHKLVCLWHCGILRPVTYSWFSMVFTSMNVQVSHVTKFLIADITMDKWTLVWMEVFLVVVKCGAGTCHEATQSTFKKVKHAMVGYCMAFREL